jgi:hypothetical protein
MDYMGQIDFVKFFKAYHRHDVFVEVPQKNWLAKELNGTPEVLCNGRFIDILTSEHLIECKAPSDSPFMLIRTAVEQLMVYEGHYSSRKRVVVYFHRWHFTPVLPWCTKRNARYG